MKVKIKKGDIYECIENYYMYDGSLAYKKGKKYISDYDGNLPDEIDYISHSMDGIENFWDYFIKNGRIEVGSILKCVKTIFIPGGIKSMFEKGTEYIVKNSAVNKMMIYSICGKHALSEKHILKDYKDHFVLVKEDIGKKDNINPDHYKQGKVECIDALEAATVNKTGLEAVCTANIIKYIWRYESKNGVEDCEKAKWYLNKLINHLNTK